MLSSLLINIPPLEPDSLIAAGGLLPIFAVNGVELTLTQVTAEQFACSCVLPPNQVPIAVTGTSRAECLTKLLQLLTPAP